MRRRRGGRRASTGAAVNTSGGVVDANGARDDTREKVATAAPRRSSRPYTESCSTLTENPVVGKSPRCSTRIR